MWESLLALTFLPWSYSLLHFYVALGLGIVIVWASHPLGGTNNYNLMLSLEGVPKLTH
jgi:hypothetical protein